MLPPKFHGKEQFALSIGKGTFIWLSAPFLKCATINLPINIRLVFLN